MPPSHHRQQTRRARSARARVRTRNLIAFGAVLVIFLGGLGAIALTGKKPPKRPVKRSTTTTTAAVASNRCPLTDLPAPGGVVPAREPLAVKIGNEPGSPGARPQSGLDEADVVYDTPAEGGLQRYIAIFQCQSASSLGPVRSIRLDDFHLLSIFSHLAIGFVGGDNTNQALAASTPWIDDANEFAHYSAYHFDPQRTSPDSTYTSTAALWSLFGPHAAPKPIFTFSPTLPATAKPAASLAINFSAGTDVLWKWNTTTALWDHTYEGIPDNDALTGDPVSATNIVVQIVDWHHGNDVDHIGNRDVIATVVGSGPGFVFRNGKEVAITWHRASETTPTTYRDAKGQIVGLAPGRTWIEIVLNTTYALHGAFVISP